MNSLSQDGHYVVLVYCAECRFDQDPGGCFDGKSRVAEDKPINLQDAIRTGIREVRELAPYYNPHRLEFEVRDGAENGEVVFSSEFDREHVSRNGKILDCDAILEKRAHRLEWGCK